ncbi:fungal-specific transcription factor domain-containing protein [Xylaria palmicola]|nr:fungal-specific transcription factor domain-containing protein [Xylaria palmicola]
MAGDSEQPPKKPPLSCTCCRARKLKCDKQSPCHNCERSGSECVFPARKRIQRPRRTKNAELLQRLNRLESIVGRVGLANLDEVGAPPVGAPAGAADAHASEPQFHLTGPPPPDDRAPSGLGGVRPPQDWMASRYMSGEFWSSLCGEVGGLRQALEQYTDSDDEEDDNEETTPESVGGGSTHVPTSPGLLGTRQTAGLGATEHPSPEHIRYLASVYFRNVDMHLKILHRPTTLAALSHLASHPETASGLAPELTALFFAVYYAATTSLAPAECARHLGQPHADLAARFQAGVERALQRADYLNSTSLETLQALTLYTCCLRSHGGSRASWALLGLPIRLAQALGLHRDGEDGAAAAGPRLSPFEAEQRRRLWWQLVVLDVRAAEDRGTSAIVARGGYDTRLPHNVDDDEFGPGTTAPLRDRPGPSDATFSLFTAQSSGIFLNSEQPPGEAETVRRARHLEAQFVAGADPDHVGSYLASVAVRLIILKLWLTMRYPLLHPRADEGAARAAGGRGKTPSAPPADARDPTSADAAAASSASGVSAPRSSTMSPLRAVPHQSTLRTAVSIMELADFLETGPYSDRIRWWCETYVQWHPLAVTLAELCAQTQGAVVERAWQVVEVVFPRWSDRIADAKRGSLWRPIRKLYKKAKAARAAALSAARSEGAMQEKSPAHGPLTSETSAPESLFKVAEPGTDYMAIDPVLTASSDTIHPRLITDMIISESSAHALNWGSTIPHAHAWPGVSFDMPAALITNSYDITQLQTPGSGTAGTVTGDGAMDTTMMNWSTWDEFVLDTYADSNSQSVSVGSEGDQPN